MKRVSRRKQITIVGAGRLGTSLARSLKGAGYEIPEIICRASSGQKKAARSARDVGATVSLAHPASLHADVIWFCVPDDNLGDAVGELAASDWRGKIAFHSSGAITSDALQTLRQRGASVASVHPLMTFVERARPALAGVPFAVEGDAAAERVAGEIVRALGGQVFKIRKQKKAAYHAFATTICPLFMSLLATSEQIAGLAGMSVRNARQRMMPIIRQTLTNYERLGPAASFSGPIVRGDTKTISRHLKVLTKTPEARQAYSALVAAALAYLPAKNRKQISDLLIAQSQTTRRSAKGRGREGTR